MEPIADSELPAPVASSGAGEPLAGGAHDALRRAVEIDRGQKPLARRIGTTQSRLWYWLEKSRHGAAARFVLAIEAATGVPRHALRPDIYPASGAAQSQQENQEMRDAGQP